MDRASFDRLVDDVLEDLDERLADLESEAFEVDLGDGKLVVEFEDGVKFIVSRQGAASQIWLAEPGGGWHYSYKEGRWRCDKRGTDLFADLSGLISKKLGTLVNLS